MGIEREFKSPQIWADPYPFYARLRSMGPVLPIKPTLRPDLVMVRGPTFLLTRYDDISGALRDPRLVSDRLAATKGGAESANHWWVPRILRLFQSSMALKDGQDHRRLRDLVHKAFTPGRVESMTARIQELVAHHLDQASRKPTTDLIADFALPLPLTVISEMLGVPHESRMEFRRLLLGLTERLGGNGIAGFVFSLPVAVRLERFLRRLVKLRQEQPGDDLTTALVRAEEVGDRLSEDELLAMLLLLLLGGHETTVNLVGNGTVALLENPDQLRKLREHPELIDTAVEELLRYTNPVEHVVRFATEDLEIKGQRIPRGSALVLLIASANHDEAAFEDAERLDVARDPNRHVSFGYGVHYCLGAPLARLEGRIAFLELLRRFPDMALAVPREQLRWRNSVGLRGLRALPLHLGGAGPRAAAA